MRSILHLSARNLRSRGLALLGALVLLVMPALTGAAAAAPLPKGEYWYEQLDLADAWKVTRGAGVTVAVVDSGVQSTVGDLAGRVLPGLDLSGTDPDAHHDSRIPGEGDFGHGTAMAALIAGNGSGGGLRGIAPQAKILPVDADGATQNAVPDEHIAQGITWSVDHGAQVVNVSLGGVGACPPDVQTALTYAYRHDVIVVAAAGDDTGVVAKPALCPGAIAVGGVNRDFSPWSKSPSGPQLDFVAPASYLVNELLDGTVSSPNINNAGTSQAAAMVSGTFALLRAHFPHDTARQLVTRAIYYVHNGLSTGHEGTRANDRIGYGLILPRFALTESVPANAANPIVDSWMPTLGAPSGTSTASVSSSASGTAPTAAPSTGGADQPSTSTSVAASGGSGSSGVPPVLIIVIVAAVVIGVVAAVGASRRRSATRGPSGYPPAPPGYGR